MLFMCQCVRSPMCRAQASRQIRKQPKVFNGILALARVSCVILMDFLKLSEFYFLICRMRVVSRSTCTRKG